MPIPSSHALYLHRLRQRSPRFFIRKWGSKICSHHASLGYCEYTGGKCMSDSYTNCQEPWNVRVLHLLQNVSSLLTWCRFLDQRSLLFGPSPALSSWTISKSQTWLTFLVLTVTWGCWRKTVHIANDLTLNHDSYPHGKLWSVPQSYVLLGNSLWPSRVRLLCIFSFLIKPPIQVSSSHLGSGPAFILLFSFVWETEAYSREWIHLTLCRYSSVAESVTVGHLVYLRSSYWSL